MFITIKVYSKNYNSLHGFSEFLSEHVKNLEKVCVVISSVKKIKVAKKRFTVLKSPHVNKTAQEQFETALYQRNFNIYSYQGFLLLLILKRVNVSLFHDLKVVVELSLNGRNFTKSLKSNFNSNKISFIKNVKKEQSQDFPNHSCSLKSYLKSLDVYGEFNFKNISLDSSVG